MKNIPLFPKVPSLFGLKISLMFTCFEILVYKKVQRCFMV